MADVRMLRLGCSGLLSALMPSLSRRNGERGVPAHPAVPARQLACWAAPGHLWPCEGRTCPLAPCPSVLAAGTAPPAAIFKAPGLHPKFSELYFWCEMILLGGGRGDFFFLDETHGFGGRERERNSWAQLEEKQGELVAPKVWSRGRALLSSAPCQWFAHGPGIRKAWAWFAAGVC